jgi:alkaline phosphatase
MERRAAAVPLLAAAALAVALGCAAANRPAPAPTAAAAASAARPRAVVLFIGDGMGFSQLAVTRDLLYGKGERLALERGLPVTGIVTTWSNSNLVTDSGAAATALGCGVKTDNREVGRDPAQRPLRCIAEVARAHGWRIGYVTTTRITHATPAAFYAHGERYDDEASFAPQLLAQAPELALGGGAGLFLPKGAGGERADGRDLLAAARQAGYAVWTQAAEVAAPPPSRLLGLFAPDHFPFELDRERLPEAERPPSLAALTRLALGVLGREDGTFFLMVEGGRIDHAAHGFDPAGTAAETRAFDRAVEEALAFQRARPGTLLLLTADHATGGLAINDDADWAALARQRASVAWLARALRKGAGGEVVAEATGYELTPEEVAAVRAPEDVYEAERALGTALARRHRITFMPKVNLDDTKGHTGEDVPLYAGGPGAERFAGVLDNAELPRRLAALLGWEWTPGPR